MTDGTSATMRPGPPGEAVFSKAQVARLHQYQFGPWANPLTGEPRGTPHRHHPFTCPDRDDHPVIAGDKGILVPTVRGWICQCCGYTQDWAHEHVKGEP